MVVVLHHELHSKKSSVPPDNPRTSRASGIHEAHRLPSNGDRTRLRRSRDRSLERAPAADRTCAWGRYGNDSRCCRRVRWVYSCWTGRAHGNGRDQGLILPQGQGHASPRRWHRCQGRQCNAFLRIRGVLRARRRIRDIDCKSNNNDGSCNSEQRAASSEQGHDTSCPQ